MGSEKFVIPRLSGGDYDKLMGCVSENIKANGFTRRDANDPVFREDHPSWNEIGENGRIWVSRPVKNKKKNYEIGMGLEIIDSRTVLVYCGVTVGLANGEVTFMHLADLTCSEHILQKYQSEEDRRYLSSLPCYCVLTVDDMEHLSVVQRYMLNNAVSRVQRLLKSEGRAELVCIF